MSLIYWVKLFRHFHWFYFVILLIILRSFFTHFNIRNLRRMRISLSYSHINLIINFILAIWFIDINDFEWRLHVAGNKISTIKTLFGTWSICRTAWNLMINITYLNSPFLNNGLSNREIRFLLRKYMWFWWNLYLRAIIWNIFLLVLNWICIFHNFDLVSVLLFIFICQKFFVLIY